MGVTVTLCF